MNIDIDKLHKLPQNEMVSVAEIIQMYFHETYKESHSYIVRIKMCKDFISGLEDNNGN